MDRQTKAISTVVGEAKIQFTIKSGNVLTIKIAKKIWAKLVQVHKEIIFSGGIDTQICYYNVNKFETTRPRKIMPYPQQNNIFEVCRKKRLLLSRFETRIKIWKLKDTPSKQ